RDRDGPSCLTLSCVTVRACTICFMAMHRTVGPSALDTHRSRHLLRPPDYLQVAALLVGILSAGFCASGENKALPDPQAPVHASLIAEHSALQRGRTTWLAGHLSMKPGWPTYWRNPGDSGLATTIKWTLPEGVTAGPIVWPVPARFVAGSIVGFGYSDEVALLAAVRLPATFPFDNLAIGATVSWLACEKVCVPGSEPLAIALPVTDPSSPAPPPHPHPFPPTPPPLPP